MKLNKIDILMIFIGFLSVVLIVSTFLMDWIKKAECDSMNGSYLVVDDGIFHKTVCSVTKQTTIKKCMINDKIVNCSDIEEMNR